MRGTILSILHAFFAHLDSAKQLPSSFASEAPTRCMHNCVDKVVETLANVLAFMALEASLVHSHADLKDTAIGHFSFALHSSVRIPFPICNRALAHFMPFRAGRHLRKGPLRRHRKVIACTAQPTSNVLAGKVAVVTGASRGIGKGIALELGACGATVYIVSRSSRSTGMTSERSLGDGHLDYTVERTAEEVNALGGNGVPVPMDVANDSDMQSLVERVQNEQGRLDALICSAFTTPPKLSSASFRDEFWKQKGDMWDACHQVGLRSMYVAACEAVPLMIDTAKQDQSGSESNRPLIVLISSFGGKSYIFNVAYGVGKAATDRLASDMSYQLEKYNVDTVSLYPGVVRTEGNIEMERRGEWAAASGGLDLSRGESPRFTGRAVVRLLLEKDAGKRKSRSGKVAVVAELAKEMGFDDVDGKLPPSIRSLKFILPNIVLPQIEKKTGTRLPLWVSESIPDVLLPWSVFSSEPPPTFNSDS